LNQLRNGQDEELASIISSHQESTQPDGEDMALLPDMQPFRLGRPLDVGKGINYIGGLDASSSDPCPEFAFFTSEEEESDSDSDVDF
jgi:hypothetical protein